MISTTDIKLKRYSGLNDLSSSPVFSNEDGFSFIGTLGSLVNNEEFKKGYVDFFSGNDNQHSYIWKCLSVIGQDCSQALYENVLNYVDNIGNVDLCKVKALKSMIKILGINYTLFDSIDNIPDEVLQLIDILSINKKYLLRNNVFNKAFEDEISLSSNAIIDGKATTIFKDGLSNDQDLAGLSSMTYVEKDERVFDDDRYRKFVENKFTNVLSSFVYCQYADEENSVHNEENKDPNSKYIFYHIIDQIMSSQNVNDDANESSYDTTIRYLKTKYNITKFDQSKIVDAIERGVDDISNYTAPQKEIIEVEQLRRSDTYSSPQKYASDKTTSLAKNLTRYSWYREQKVKEYFNFVNNMYTQLISENKIQEYLASSSIDKFNDSVKISEYDKDNRYFQIDSNNANMLIDFSVNNGVQTYKIDNTIIQKVSQALTNQVFSIIELREQIKTQTQKTYMKGTFLLLSYMINEYLIHNVAEKYGKLISSKSQSSNEEDFSKVIKRSIANRDSVKLIEYNDVTEYYNLSTDNSLCATNSNRVNDKFWDNEWSKMGENTLDLPFNEIEQFYMKNMQFDKNIDNMYNFLSLVFESGATKSFINKENGDFEVMLSTGIDTIETKERMSYLSTVVNNLQHSLSIINASADMAGYKYDSKLTFRQQCESIRNIVNNFLISSINLSNETFNDISSQFTNIVNQFNNTLNQTIYKQFLNATQYDEYQLNQWNTPIDTYYHELSNYVFKEDKTTFLSTLRSFESYCNDVNNFKFYYLEDKLRTLSNDMDQLQNSDVSGIYYVETYIKDTLKIDDQNSHSNDIDIQINRLSGYIDKYIRLQLQHQQKHITNLTRSKDQLDEFLRLFSEAKGLYLALRNMHESGSSTVALGDFWITAPQDYGDSKRGVSFSFANGLKECSTSSGNKLYENHSHYVNNRNLISKTKLASTSFTTTSTDTLGDAKTYVNDDQTFYIPTSQIMRGFPFYAEIETNKNGVVTDVNQKIVQTTSDDNVDPLALPSSYEISSVASTDKSAYEQIVSKCQVISGKFNAVTKNIKSDIGCLFHNMDIDDISVICKFDVSSIGSENITDEIDFSSWGVVDGNIIKCIYDQLNYVLDYANNMQASEKIISSDTNAVNDTNDMKNMLNSILDKFNTYKLQYQDLLKEKDVSEFYANDYTTNSKKKLFDQICDAIVKHNDICASRRAALKSKCDKFNEQYELLLSQIKKYYDNDFKEYYKILEIEDDTWKENIYSIELEDNIRYNNVIQYAIDNMKQLHIANISNYDICLLNKALKYVRTYFLISTIANLTNDQEQYECGINYVFFDKDYANERIEIKDAIESVIDIVKDTIQKLYYEDDSWYFAQKDIYLKYNGTDIGYDPVYNHKNVTHSSYQLHPYLYNFVKMSNIVYPIESLFHVVFTESYEQDIIDMGIDNIVGKYGNIIDIWKFNWFDWSGYSTRYEMSNHKLSHSSNQIKDQIDYDGGFYPPALEEYLADPQKFAKSVRNNTNQYYQFLNLSKNDRDKIYYQLLEYESAIRELVGIPDGNKATSFSKENEYDVYKYAIDLYGNSILLYKNYKWLYDTIRESDDYVKQLPAAGDPVNQGSIKYVEVGDGQTTKIEKYVSNVDPDQKSYQWAYLGDYEPSYNEKKNTTGELWIRVKNHPIAFPAFDLRRVSNVNDISHFTIEKSQVTKNLYLNSYIEEMNNYFRDKYSNNLDYIKREKYKDTLRERQEYEKVNGDNTFLRVFYDMEINPDLQAIALNVPYKTGSGDLRKRHDHTSSILDTNNDSYYNSSVVLGYIVQKFDYVSNTTMYYFTEDYNNDIENPNLIQYNKDGTLKSTKWSEFIGFGRHNSYLFAVFNQKTYRAGYSDRQFPAIDSAGEEVKLNIIIKGYRHNTTKDNNIDVVQINDLVKYNIVPWQYNTSKHNANDNNEDLNHVQFSYTGDALYFTYAGYESLNPDADVMRMNEDEEVAKKWLDAEQIPIVAYPEYSNVIETRNADSNFGKSNSYLSATYLIQNQDRTKYYYNSFDSFTQHIVNIKYKFENFRPTFDSVKYFNLNADLGYIPVYQSEIGMTRLYKNKSLSAQNEYAIELLGMEKTDEPIGTIIIDNKVKHGRVVESYRKTSQYNFVQNMPFSFDVSNDGKNATLSIQLSDVINDSAIYVPEDRDMYEYVNSMKYVIYNSHCQTSAMFQGWLSNTLPDMSNYDKYGSVISDYDLLGPNGVSYQERNKTTYIDNIDELVCSVLTSNSQFGPLPQCILLSCHFNDKVEAGTKLIDNTIQVQFYKKNDINNYEKYHLFENSTSKLQSYIPNNAAKDIVYRNDVPLQELTSSIFKPFKNQNLTAETDSLYEQYYANLEFKYDEDNKIGSEFPELDDAVTDDNVTYMQNNGYIYYFALDSYDTIDIKPTNLSIINGSTMTPNVVQLNTSTSRYRRFYNDALTIQAYYEVVQPVKTIDQYEIVLYFNYYNYYAKPYYALDVDDNSTPADLTDDKLVIDKADVLTQTKNTYLKLAPHETGKLDIYINYLKYDRQSTSGNKVIGTNVVGVGSNVVKTYYIMNISDDKPKFLISRHPFK